MKNWYLWDEVESLLTSKTMLLELGLWLDDKTMEKFLQDVVKSYDLERDL